MSCLQYYYAPGGQRYRSKNEVAKTLGIDLPSRAPKSDVGEDGVKVSKVGNTVRTDFYLVGSAFKRLSSNHLSARRVVMLEVPQWACTP